MDGEGIATLGEEGELGHQLLGELMGTVDVVAAGDDAWQLVAGHVCLHHHLSTSLQVMALT